MSSLNLTLSLDEILFAAILGLVITWLLQNIIKFRKLIKDVPVSFDAKTTELNKIMERCYALFPIEKVLFKGETFLRGSKIRITTLQNKIFEGELIGLNNKNMICIMTKKYIMAHEINNIENINMLEK